MEGEVRDLQEEHAAAGRCLERDATRLTAEVTLHPTPYTLHPSFTLHPTPYTLHLSPFTQVERTRAALHAVQERQMCQLCESAS